MASRRKYLAPYIFRVAISNSRLVSCENNQVTFRYRDSHTGQPKLLTLESLEFIHRFLQHVLPKGFVKVRYYGLFSPGRRQHLALVRQLLTPANAEPVTPTPSTTEPAPSSNSGSETATPPPSPSATASDSPTSETSLLVELEDEPNAPDEPAAPAPPSSAPRCPTCG